MPTLHCRDCSPAYLCAACAALLARAQGGTPLPVPAESERSFQGRVLRVAKEHSFRTYHTERSDGSAPGFPDLVMVRPQSATRPGRLLIVELKSQRGKLTKDQAEWLSLLRHSIPGLEVYDWHPADWDTIVDILA